MRKVILGLAVSLDGFIEGPHGEYDWCFTDQDYGMGEFLKSIDAIFYGRKSYDMMVNASGDQGNPFKAIKPYVFSNTLPVSNAYHLVSGDIPGEVKRIKAEPGKDIWLFGGASLTASFINAGLVDQLWLSIHPILLGKGKLLSGDIAQRVNLKLLEHKAYNTGLVSVRYAL
jgi:dihydrofolate reductase